MRAKVPQRSKDGSLDPGTASKRFIGRAPSYLRCISQAKRVSPLPIDVLIMGPSGSGKEHIAHSIHEHSNRAGPWVPVNCATLNSELGAAELFGHKKGAFTGANRDKPGLIQRAEGGTLFFDEVAELDLKVQAKLLRFLEERRYRALGAEGEIQADIRILAATCRPLRIMVEDGEFRDDLYQRLAGYVLQVPSLRERSTDIVPLARHFLREDPVCEPYEARLSRDGARLLQMAPWPGNIRELRRLLRSILLDSSPKTINAAHVGKALGWPNPEAMLPERVSPKTAVLSALRTRGSLGSGGLVRETGLSRSTISRAVKHLLTEGEIESVGSRPRLRYRIQHMSQIGSIDLPENLRQVKQTLIRRKSIQSSELARALGVSPRTATRWLSQLVELGEARAIGGARRGRRYTANS